MREIFVRSSHTPVTSSPSYDTPRNPLKNPFSEIEVEGKPGIPIYQNDSQDPLPVLSFQKMKVFVERKHDGASDPFSTGHETLAEALKNLVPHGDETRSNPEPQSYGRDFWKDRLVLPLGTRWSDVHCTDGYSMAEGNRGLAEFSTRFYRMSPDVRGWGPTVEDASKKWTKGFVNAIRKHTKDSRSGVRELKMKVRVHCFLNRSRVLATTNRIRGRSLS